ncbi:MAG: ABC transporter ATP-binding protein [Bacteroidota bacterium]
MVAEQALAISIEHLGFRYPGNANVSFANLNLQVPKGARFGLFGPNGAGKTTLMNLMTGVLSPDNGGIKILGLDTGDKAANNLFGFVPQDFSFYQELSPAENLEFFGAWAGLNKSEIAKRTIELLTILGLNDVRDKPVEKFSGGMKRRVNLAIGVIHNPQVLFLDEPTVGVDVQTRHAIISYLLELNKQGTTLIYTSHHLGEAEDLCDQIALVDEGQIIAEGQIDDVLKAYNHQNLEDLFINLTGKAYRD